MNGKILRVLKDFYDTLDIFIRYNPPRVNLFAHSRACKYSRIIFTVL